MVIMILSSKYKSPVTCSCGALDVRGGGSIVACKIKKKTPMSHVSVAKEWPCPLSIIRNVAFHYNLRPLVLTLCSHVT